MAAFLALALLWWGVFTLLGRLWWSADPARDKVPPPRPVAVHPPPHDWVDLQKYSREHPVWEPARE